MQYNDDCKVVVLGAGGFARELAGWLGDKIKYFYEEKKTKDELFGIPVHDYLLDGDVFVVGTGSPNINERLFVKAVDSGLKPSPGFVSSRAYVGKDVTILGGTVVCPFAMITGSSHIGLGCVINNGALVPHDVTLGKFVVVSPNVSIGGKVFVGDNVLLGIGSTIKPDLIIGNKSIVGCGAVVVKDVLKKTIVVGNPAKEMKK